MSVRATRQLLDAIAGFDAAYAGDPKFKGLLDTLDGVEQQAEKLVPAAADRSPDEADEADQPRTLPEAARESKARLAAGKAEQTK